MEPKITYNSSYDKCPPEVKSKIHFYLTELAEQVQRNARALLYPRYTQNQNPENVKLNHWYMKCQEYFDSGEPPFDIYMTYGYAVEELTNLTYTSVSYPYSLKPQIPYNGSICDYELGIYWARKYIVLAWIDITSEDSEDHIWNKAAGRWHSAPCACEIFYEPLVPEKLLSLLDGSIGQNIHILSQIRRREIEKTKCNDYLINCMHDVLNILYMSQIPLSEVPHHFYNVFQTEMPSHCHIVCHALLALFLRKAAPNDIYRSAAWSVIYHYYSDHHYRDTTIAERYLEQSYRQNTQEQYIYY